MRRWRKSSGHRVAIEGYLPTNSTKVKSLREIAGFSISDEPPQSVTAPLLAVDASFENFASTPRV
ncbi:hypothetical protein D3C81_854140 [compost metagenome]